jgi:hypothetical protein
MFLLLFEVEGEWKQLSRFVMQFLVFSEIAGFSWMNAVLFGLIFGFGSAVMGSGR